jgi:hypothetical protein
VQLDVNFKRAGLASLGLDRRRKHRYVQLIRETEIKDLVCVEVEIIGIPFEMCTLVVQ